MGRPPIAGELDGILCSASQANRVWGEDLLQSGQFDEADLINLVHGDICGVLIAHEGMEKKVARLSQRWTCLQEHHLKACAKKAAADNSLPGVILACIGSNKARCVFECLRRGYVKSLIIDDDLAD